ncbi:response regulator [Sphingomonas immobilis]|uniref:Response regulator n=1 Tax=Sphingomonas immobilis TaxID=3063997 RepID=A0ABT9A1E5_9SPHN|nr:response regulator [Sphingomonas sp. CA1-15]MDO7843645.1 response regulator [Sphingomonas sp. CA1-15]
MSATKVLVVDDSTTMRAILTSALERNTGIVVVGSAGGAEEARHMIAAYHPDVITLDVEMPGMTGIEFLEELMTTRPIRVVMLSSQTPKNSTVGRLAAKLGAVSFVPKPPRSSPDEFSRFSAMLGKVVLAAAATDLDVRKVGNEATIGVDVARDYHWDGAQLTIEGGDVGARYHTVVDLRRIAAELRATAEGTEEVGNFLTDDPDLCERYAKELQAIDRLAQRQRCLADMITAATLDEAKAACSLDELVRVIF